MDCLEVGAFVPCWMEVGSWFMSKAGVGGGGGVRGYSYRSDAFGQVRRCLTISDGLRSVGRHVLVMRLCWSSPHTQNDAASRLGVLKFAGVLHGYCLLGAPQPPPPPLPPAPPALTHGYSPWPTAGRTQQVNRCPIF